MNCDSETVHLPKAWTKTDWSGGDECLGEAISECGAWRLVRKLFMAGGGCDRYHWFIEIRAEFDGVAEWLPTEIGGAGHYRTLTEAKKYLTIEGIIQNGRERGLL